MTGEWLRTNLPATGRMEKNEGGSLLYRLLEILPEYSPIRQTCLITEKDIYQYFCVASRLIASIKWWKRKVRAA